MQSRLRLTRQQILAFRRSVGALDERMPKGPESLRRAAWAGLQDSMPRAALLSLHARVEEVEPSTWEDPSLAQLWGPRYQTYVVAKRDFALFSLGRLPDNAKSRLRAEQMAERLRLHLDGGRMADREAGRALGMNPNAFRYAAPTGTVAIRWEGARAPTIWTVAAPDDRPGRRLPRARSTLPPHLRADDGRWVRPLGGDLAALGGRCLRVAGGRTAARALAARRRVPARRRRAGRAVRDPDPCRARALAAEWRCLLPAPRGRAGAPRPPSGSAARLWTSRVWPGALLVEGEIRGTWRRAQHTVRIDTWARLSRAARDAIEAEAGALPLPGLDRRIDVVWDA